MAQIIDQLIGQKIKIIWKVGGDSANVLTLVGIENGFLWIHDSTFKYARMINLSEVKEMHSLAGISVQPVDNEPLVPPVVNPPTAGS